MAGVSLWGGANMVERYHEEMHHDAANAVIAQGFIDDLPTVTQQIEDMLSAKNARLADYGQVLGAGCMVLINGEPETAEEIVEANSCTLNPDRIYDAKVLVDTTKHEIGILESYVQPDENGQKPLLESYVDKANNVIKDGATQSAVSDFYDQSAEGPIGIKIDEGTINDIHASGNEYDQGPVIGFGFLDAIGLAILAFGIKNTRAKRSIEKRREAMLKLSQSTESSVPEYVI
ncbi:MAG: hypothetical protein JWO47_646 [Candidatus Saccharibacteria bacterium]|nr:hypothetical protein [Candidatus Saccharibacteria bacterium]